MPRHVVAYRQGQRLDRFASDQLSDILQQPEAFIWLINAHLSPE